MTAYLELKSAFKEQQILANIVFLVCLYLIGCVNLLYQSDYPMFELGSCIAGLFSVCLIALCASTIPAPQTIKQLVLASIAFIYAILAISSYATSSNISFLSIYHALATTSLKDLAILARHHAPPNVFLCCMLSYLILVFISLGIGVITKKITVQPRTQLCIMFGSALMYLGMIALNINSKEPLSNLALSLARHPLASIADGPYEQLPLISERQNQEMKALEALPNIFIILMESYNPIYINKKGPDNREITPVINSIKTNSVWINDFFGNGVYSFVGQLSLLQSMYPDIAARPSIGLTNSSRVGLPSVLNKSGYKTWYLSAYYNLYYNPLTIFSNRLGFYRTMAMDESNIGEEFDGFSWGWGLQDDKFYQRCFQILKTSDTNAPVFAVLANGSNHTPFIIPEHLRRFYPFPKTTKEKYMDSVAFADESLRTFYKELEDSRFASNTIVVIVGDHGFPMGERGNYLSISKANEENFRTICAIQWKGKLAPATIQNSFSQIDIAPTLLQLIGISAPSSFRGKSFFGESPTDNIAIASQPYDGGFITAFSEGYTMSYSCQSRAFFVTPWLSNKGDQGIPSELERRMQKRLTAMAVDLTLNSQER